MSESLFKAIIASYLPELILGKFTRAPSPFFLCVCHRVDIKAGKGFKQVRETELICEWRREAPVIGGQRSEHRDPVQRTEGGKKERGSLVPMLGHDVTGQRHCSPVPAPKYRRKHSYPAVLLSLSGL